MSRIPSHTGDMDCPNMAKNMARKSVTVPKEDYITAAYAKGMSRSQVLWKYAFKNALIPIITLVGVQIGVFLAGTVVVETIGRTPPAAAGAR